MANPNTPNNPNNPNNPNSPSTGQNDMEDQLIQDARNQAQNQMDNAIDQFAQKIPGGQMVSGEAKNAAHGLLDNLEHQADEKADEALGGMLGNIFHKGK